MWSTIVVGGLYLGFRTVYWGYLAHEIIYVQPRYAESYSYQSLHNACCEQAATKMDNPWERGISQAANSDKIDWIAEAAFLGSGYGMGSGLRLGSNSSISVGIVVLAAMSVLLLIYEMIMHAE
ncbi:MAG: hypothetical protein OEZ48_17220 [Candidatus Bathyarchaeota archaeon]|nr:hypothetical protein [Candidatus Bathyarchaeota archaeon]MDH5689593.1 hypothetical protein [Candidatus Bathyarchaeota archaeon]